MTRIGDRLLESLFPELERFGDPDSRKAALKISGGTVLTAGFLLGMIPQLVILKLSERISSHLNVPELVVFIVAACTPVATMWLLGRFYRRKIQVSLRKQLNDAGIPVCMGCAYDLRGQTVGRCPECGVAFDLPDSGRAPGQERTQSEDFGGRTP